MEIRSDSVQTYDDVFTDEACAALTALGHFDVDRKALMQARLERRAARARDSQPITFLDPHTQLTSAGITVSAARNGQFDGSDIPDDLQRQWIQGTGPGAKPRAPLESSIRNVAYALLSGADGWMFDGEDALGQISNMSLDNQRNLPNTSPVK